MTDIPFKVRVYAMIPHVSGAVCNMAVRLPLDFVAQVARLLNVPEHEVAECIPFEFASRQEDHFYVSRVGMDLIGLSKLYLSKCNV